LDTTFEVPRSQASLVYSFALAVLAFCVLIGPRFYSRWSAAVFITGVGVIACVGCLLAGFAKSMAVVWLGYSVLFGAANGFGYGYALQLPAQVMPERKGLAMGAVTAAYALGAILFPLFLVKALEQGGWQAACTWLAIAVFLMALVSAGMMAKASARYQLDTADTSLESDKTISWPTLGLWWLAYCSAVIAGLMAIGHATGIAGASGITSRWVVLAPIVMALSNLAGSLSCGALVDKVQVQVPLAGLPLLSGGCLLVMALLLNPVLAIPGLAIIGFCYGGIISVYPAVIAKRFGAQQGPIIYGRVFTGWAVAGLLGPGLAGLLFDFSGDYSLALGFAASMALLSLLVIVIFQKRLVD